MTDKTITAGRETFFLLLFIIYLWFRILISGNAVCSSLSVIIVLRVIYISSILEGVRETEERGNSREVVELAEASRISKKMMHTVHIIFISCNMSN